jgi:hypothetical protein
MVEKYLNELEESGIIKVTKKYKENKIFHFNNIINEHYSIAKIDNVWELMNWQTLDIIEIFANDKDLINNLYLYV